MTEFATEVRHYCRNPKCRSKLPKPVSNEREAFCARAVTRLSIASDASIPGGSERSGRPSMGLKIENFMDELLRSCCATAQPLALYQELEAALAA